MALTLPPLQRHPQNPSLKHLLSDCFQLDQRQKISLLTCALEVEYEGLNPPIATKVVCFSRLLKCLGTSMASSVDPDQTAPIGAVCSGFTLFAAILYSSVMLGNYLH